MSSTNPLKTGIVGLSLGGWASMVTFPALQTERNAQMYDVVAISTRSYESAANASKKYAEVLKHEVQGYHGDPAQLVYDPNIDIVGVSVKTPDHAKVMKHVLEAGKPFFLEWPAGCGSSETREFYRLAEEKQLKHVVCLQDRYNPCVEKMKELLDSGTIGKVQAVNLVSHCSREIAHWGPELWENDVYSNEPESHTTLLDIFIMHQMEPFTYLLGDWASVTATTSTQWPVVTLIPSGRKVENKNPDHYAFSGILVSGAQVSCSYRAGYPLQGRKSFLWEIDGTDGILRFEIETSGFMATTKGRLFLNDKEVQIDKDNNGVLSMARIWEEFAKPDGKYIKLADAVRLKTLGDAIQTSAREGRRVELQ